MDLIPSRNRDLLAALIGDTIARVARVSFDALDEVLEAEAYTSRALGPRDLFAMGFGPVRIDFGGGTALMLQGTYDTVSVELQPWDDEVGEGATFVEATDAAHAQARFAAVIGKRVTGIRVLQRGAPPDTKLGDRPREAALCFALDGGPELVIAYSLIDAPDELAVALGDELPATGWTELFRLPG